MFPRPYWQDYGFPFRAKFAQLAIFTVQWIMGFYRIWIGLRLCCPGEAARERFRDIYRLDYPTMADSSLAGSKRRWITIEHMNRYLIKPWLTWPLGESKQMYTPPLPPGRIFNKYELIPKPWYIRRFMVCSRSIYTSFMFCSPFVLISAPVHLLFMLCSPCIHLLFPVCSCFVPRGRRESEQTGNKR